MKSHILLSLVLVLIFNFFSASAKKKDPVLMTIGNQSVSVSEFTTNYLKNNTNVLDKSDQKTPEEYLDLYVRFKLKVIEAQALGYDTMRSFIQELKGYRKDLARPYLTDVTYNEEMVKTAYYRTKNERKASHLLVLVDQNASAEDTLKAWNKVNDLLTQIKNGADFGEVAEANSEDPSAKQNKGLLGYFNAFQMVFPFEDMTYKTPIGQVSPIFRTRFGYHLVKVHDERPSSGEIKVAHIMKMFPQQANDSIIAVLKLKTDSIWQKASSGSDFATLAKTYSDDRNSAEQGGEMNWFTMTNMVPSFAEAAFALKNDGDISPVIQTPYGWHIIKRTEYKPTPEFEQLRADLEQKIKQNPEISHYETESFIRKLKSEYKFQVQSDNLMALEAIANDTVRMKEWTSSIQPLNKNLLIQFADKQFTVGDFNTYLESKQFAQTVNGAGQLLKSHFDQFSNDQLLEFEDTQLERKYPDFAKVIKEYHDGILLFNISKDKIWDVASTDTIRLQEYYNGPSTKYFWGERYKGFIIKAKDAETKTKVETQMDGREMSQEELMATFNPSGESNIEITVVANEKGENPIVDYLIWNGSKPVDFDDSTTFIHGKITKDEQKTLDDAWGIYSSDFQEIVEKEWIDSLKAKYPVKVNEKLLGKIDLVK